MRKFIKTSIVKVVGVVLIIIGIIGFFLPILPFFIPMIIGLGLLGVKPEFIEKIKMRIRQTWLRFRKKL